MANRNTIQAGLKILAEVVGQEQIDNLGQSLEGAADKAGLFAGAGEELLGGLKNLTAVGGLGMAAKEAMEFETAMAGVKKVAEGTDEQYATLANSLKELSQEMGIMPAALADIAAAGGQMGVAMERLPEFTRMAAQMSVAFNLTAEQAGEIAAKTSNVFGLQLDEMERVGDAINTLGNTTAAKEAEIAQVLLRIGGAAKQFGLTAEQASALGAAFVSLGKSPEVAGTAINALLQKLQNAKLGTADFQAGLAAVGYTADEMAEKIAANPQQALNEFLNSLQKLDKQAQSETIGRMFGTEYADDVAVLVGSLKTYEQALANATDREKTLGAMQKETQNALSTTAAQVEKAKASLAVAAGEIGTALLPTLQAAAGAAGGVAKALGNLAGNYPVLTQIGVLFVAAKVGMAGYTAALKLAGQESQTSIFKTDVGLKKLVGSLKAAALAARGLGTDMRNALNGFDANSKSMMVQTNYLSSLRKGFAGAAQGALGLWSAWEAGKGIGSSLRESSEWVRDFGDGLGKAVAYVDAIFTDRTFEDVKKLYRTTKQEMRDAERAAKAAEEAKQKEAEAARKAAAEQDARIEAARKQQQALQQEVARHEASQRALAEAGLAGGEAYRALGEEARKAREKLAAANAELGGANTKINENSRFYKQQQALKDLGLTAEQVATGVGESAQKAIDSFSQAAEHFGSDTETMRRLFEAAMQKMDSPEAVAKLKESLASVGEKAGLTADQIRQIGAAAPETADRVAEAFAKIGVDTQAVMSGISTEAKRSMDDFKTALGAAAEQGVDDIRLLAAGFEQMMDKLKSPEEFAAFKKALEDSGATAKLTREQIDRLNAAAEKGALAAVTAYRKLTDSLKQATDTTQIQAAAQAAEQAMKRGEISAEQYQEVLQAVREKTATLKRESEQEGAAAAQAHQKAADAAEKRAQTEKQAAQSAAESSAETKQGAERAAAAVQTAARQVSGFGQVVQQYWHKNQHGNKMYSLATSMQNEASIMSGAWASYVQGMWRMRDSTKQAIADLDTSMQTGANTAGRLAAAEALAAANADKLDQATLDNLNASIDAARRKMQDLADEAKNARQEAEKELLQVQGKTDELARREEQQKLDRLRQAQTAAQTAGNAQAANDYAAAMAAVQQTYHTKRQQAKRQAEEKNEKNQEIELPKSRIDVGSISMERVSGALDVRDEKLVEKVKEKMEDELFKAIKRKY